MFVIGTAGHVDHGKSALVRALSGIDPDRLQEEKDRGMTIDLGFAWLELPGGLEVSMVDVPGHERFIKNMLAGVGGIDLALLVIAADEGIMPQTREHLAILDLLGVANGVVALTKCDLVDGDWLDLVAAEVEDLISTTSLTGSPLVRCSAVTGEGIDTLRETLAARLADSPGKRDIGRPRLPIDRVFTISGFGTVVTGTLIDGTLGAGQEIEIVPAVVGGHITSLRGRVRSVQTHQHAVEVALPGTRTAVNLAGVEKDQVHRGQVVTLPGWLRPSTAVDVRLRAIDALSRPLRHNLNVSFHCFAAEAPARLRLLEADELRPGEEAWAQVRLLEPLALVNGDRFVIRDANDTIAGGVIVATQAKRHPRNRPSVLDSLEQRLSPEPGDLLLSVLSELEPAGLAALVARTALTSAQVTDALDALAAEGRAVLLGGGDARLAYTRAGFDRLKDRALHAVTDHLGAHPLRRGLSKEELRATLKLPARLFADLLASLRDAGVLTDLGTVVAPPDWAPGLSAAQRGAADAYLALLRTTPLAPPTDSPPAPELLGYLTESGAVVDAGGGVVFTAEAYESMVATVIGLLEQQGSVTMAQVRDRLGTSRKYVQALLEHMDQQRITARRGDERVLRRSGQA